MIEYDLATKSRFEAHREHVDTICLQVLAGDWSQLSALNPEDQRAVWEAAHHFGLENVPDPGRSQLSAERIGERLWQREALPDILLAIIKLGGEQTAQERRLQRVATAAGWVAVLPELFSGVVGGTIGLIKHPVAQTLSRVAHAIPGVPARGLAEMVAKRAGKSPHTLHVAVANVIADRHTIKYNDVPFTELDDDSLRAWMAAWGLERLNRWEYWHESPFAESRARLAKELTSHIPHPRDESHRVLIDFGRRLDHEAKASPPGIEMLELQRALHGGVSPFAAIGAFTDRAVQLADNRENAVKTIGLPRESTRPVEALPRLRASALQFARDSSRSLRELGAQFLSTADFETMAQQAMIIKERMQVALETGNGGRFPDVWRRIIATPAHVDVFEHHVHSQLAEIANATASLATLKLAYALVREPNLWSRRTTKHAKQIETALAKGAARWFTVEDPTLDKTTKKGQEIAVSPTSLRGMVAQVNELHIRAFIHEITELGGQYSPDHALLHVKQLLAGMPKPGSSDWRRLHRGLDSNARTIIKRAESQLAQWSRRQK